MSGLKKLSAEDKLFIRETFRLARKAEGKTSPNPLVGAVIVKGGRVLSSAFHKKAGFSHAETEALKKLNFKAEGATLYVNLEPCFHWGRTPPCVDRIISAGIKRVVIAIKDPNPLVCGKSIRKLKASGIKVAYGVFEKEAKKLNEVFIKFITKKIPFVAAKAAQSLDGKIALSSGDSQWITSPRARKFSRRLRGNYDAVLVGINTILKDNPFLDAPKKKITKIILDPQLKTSLKANIFKKGKVIIVSKYPLLPKAKHLSRKADILTVKEKEGLFNLHYLLKELYRREITSVFVEGGGNTLGRFFDARLVDKIYFFIAPKVIGGKNSLTSVEAKGVGKISEAIRIKDVEVKKIGKDYLFQGYPQYGKHK